MSVRTMGYNPRRRYNFLFLGNFFREYPKTVPNIIPYRKESGRNKLSDLWRNANVYQAQKNKVIQDKIN
jgi:hypothetical protein